MKKLVNAIARRAVRTLLQLLMIYVVSSPAASQAQAPAATAPGTTAPAPATVETPADPLSANNRMLYDGVKKILLRSAEKMPEEHYNFRPTDAVRTFGQIVGHVADSQYGFCANVRGEKNPSLKVEQTRTTKAELVTALKEAFAYCTTAYEAMTDASAVEMTRSMGRAMPKLGVLAINNVHTIEHYGNLVTYMRMKDIVPPTSEPGFIVEARK